MFFVSFMRRRLGSGYNSLHRGRSPYFGMSSRRSWPAFAAALLAAAASRGAVPSVQAEPVAERRATPPRLIVFITVDQLRSDMLDRYRRDLHLGYARLLRGARF